MDTDKENSTVMNNFAANCTVPSTNAVSGDKTCVILSMRTTALADLDSRM
jgi:hypothetical protein